MADPIIEKPLASGATDNMNAPQSGVPQNGTQVPPVPEGFGDKAPEQSPPVPAGFSDTPPEKNESMTGPEAFAQPLIGMAKGVGKSISTLGKIAHSYFNPGTEDLIYNHQTGKMDHIPRQPTKIDQGLKILDQNTEPQNAGQKAGVLLEGIGEFFVGSEELKGLNIAEKLGLAQKIADLGTKYPFLAKLIGRGIQTGLDKGVQTGIVSGGESLLKGSAPAEAAKTGVEGGVLGGGLSAAFEGAGQAGQFIKNLKDTAAKTPQELQPDFQQGIKDLVDQVADEHGIKKSTSKTMATYVQETAENLEDKARDIYQKIDQATGENFFQRIEEKLNNTKRAIRNLTGTEDDVLQEAKLEKARTELMDVSNEMWEKAKLKGVSRADYDEAVQTWKQSQALFDLDNEINRPNILSGNRPDVFTTAQAAKNPETVNTGNFFKRVNKMYKSGRLAEAVGPERAKNFLTHTGDTMADEANLLREQAHAESIIKSAKDVGKKAAIGVGIGAGTLGAGALINSMRKGAGE